MNERRMQFLVGVLVLFAAVVTGVLLIRFGERPMLDDHYNIHVQFEYAPSVRVDTPVRKSGIHIGRVSAVELNDTPGEPPVTVVLELTYAQRKSAHNPKGYRMRGDARPTIARTLLGDAAIEIIPGRSEEFLKPGARVRGSVPSDLVSTAQNLEQKIVATLDRWESVGTRLDTLLGRHENEIGRILTELTVSLRSFNQTMVSANSVLGDPRNQESIRQTLQEMPGLIAGTRDAIQSVRMATEGADANLRNLQGVTGPLAEHTRSLVEKLDTGAAHANQLLEELQVVAARMNREEGTWSQLTANPDLYNNLSKAAFNLNELLVRFETVVENFEIFSDAIARHPEKLGIRGMLDPSPGTKPAPGPALPRGRQPRLLVPDASRRGGL